jgi:hypothetical protein
VFGVSVWGAVCWTPPWYLPLAWDAGLMC